MQHLHGRCVQNQHSRPQPQQMSQTRQMHQQRAVVLPQTSARTVMSKGAEQSEAVIRVPSEAMQQVHVTSPRHLPGLRFEFDHGPPNSQGPIVVPSC
eukprot:s5195_g3.t1